jgi:hypothetical protein
MGETAQQPTEPTTITPIPAVASLRVSAERIERMWQMTAAQRVEAARQGQFTLGEMLRWASRRPSEVELVDGEFWFITAFSADADCRERLMMANVEEKWPLRGHSCGVVGQFVANPADPAVAGQSPA